MAPWGRHGADSGTGHRDDGHVRRILRWHELWAGQPREGDGGGS